MTRHSRAFRVTLAALAGIALGVASSARADWSVEAGVDRFDWREHTSPLEVRERGPMVTVGVGFMPRRDAGPLLAYRGQLYGGSVDYNGSFQFDATRAASGHSTYLGTIQGVEARWRWPDALDAVVGLDVDVWRRQLSESQRERYRIASLRLGAERPASAARRISAGAGMRIVIWTREQATIEDQGVRYDLTLSPGLGANPYAHAGYRAWPRVAIVAGWDGLTLGRSNQIVLLKRGQPQAVVSQPSTDLTRIGVRLVYAR